MSKQHVEYSDLDLSDVPQIVIEDEHWQKCIHLALRSKGKEQRYGARIISPGGEILGEGWNRSLLAGGRMERFPFRTNFMLHAEIAAMEDAIWKYGEKALKGAILYDAGFFVDERKPLIRRGRPTNTCVRCTKHYVQFGLLCAHHVRRGLVNLSGRNGIQKCPQECDDPQKR